MAGNFSDSEKQVLTQQLRSVLMRTELSGNTSYLYRFSQAGGQSTYSFGLLQFDLGKNAKAPTEAEVFLKNELGFTSSEITALKGSSLPQSTLAEFNQRLMNNQDKVDAFTDKALIKDINKLDSLITEVAQTRPDVAQSILDNSRVQLRLLDYQNQFGLSGIDNGRMQPDGFMMSYLKGNSVKMMGEPIQLPADSGLNEADLQNFRGHTLQAVTYKRDAERREDDLNVAFKNIELDSPSGDSRNVDRPKGGSPTEPNGGAGHWEDPTQYDEMGNVIQSGARVWVPDDVPPVSPDAGRGLINPPSINPDSSAPTQPNLPSTPQISPDGTTALLPNGQIIRAGTGGTLDIDADGNLVVSRPAQGWTNADGSPSDIRQVTTYDAKGAQLGTTIAQNLPGESSPVENYAHRTVQVHNPDGSTSDVNTHFQAGVGWVDDAGKTVLSLKDAQAQLDARNAHLIPGASADNDYTPGAPTGEAEARDYMGKTPAQQANPDSGGGSDADPDPQSLQGHGGSDTPSDFHTALLNALRNPELPNTNGPTTQYAGPGLPEIASAPSPAPEPNPNSLSSYFQTQGAALTPKQQDALTSQINQLKLGSSDDLSFYRLPDGSTLIANADGDLVGQLGAPRNGEISLRANAIGQDGSATTHERTITTDGQTTSYSPHTLAQVDAGLSLIQGLDGLQHWDQMGDVARFSSLVGLASSFNTLSGGALGDLGKLGTAASVLGLMQALQDGNTAGIISGINGLSGGQIDLAINGAVNNALGTASSVPYVSVALALNDFEKHVGQSIGTLVGTYFGGTIGGAIGAMVGGLLDSMFGGGRSDPPPPPAGIVHFSWDADGQIQHTIDHNQSGGGTAANQAAASMQALLENVVQAVNEANAQKTGDHSHDVAINPYLLPRIHYGSGGACMEVTQFDGSTTLEGIGQEGFAERLIAILQDNGALAPAWQVATVQGHWAQAQEELADLREQLSEAQQSENPQVAQLQQQIDARQQALDHELHAGKGGHAYAGNEAYSLQGNAAESADFKTQDFGVLVVHVSEHARVQASAQALDQTLENIQKQALQLSETLRDVEDDGYAERSDWISATDGAGNLQGLLVLDQNSDGLIQTRDILNLGGNAGQAGNPTTEAGLVTENAALQHNNVQWLDANGDGVLDARDPAFAAVKLWVDLNQDGQMQASEGASLADMGLQSINFQSGEVVYADGQRDALSAATLHADTDGVRMTQISEVTAQGLIGFGSDNGAICPQQTRRALRMRGFRCIGAHGMPPSYVSIKSTSLI